MKKKTAKKAAWGGPRPNSGRPRKTSKKITRSFALSAEAVATIDALADREKISKSEALEKLIERGIEKK